MVENELNTQQARYNMIQQMLRPWKILNQRVLDVFETVSRDQFVPKEYVGVAFSEIRIPLNEEVSMLSPILEGRFLQELRVEKEERVLLVGTGSGFLAALLSRLGKEVVSIDIDPELNREAEAITQGLGFNNIEYKTHDIAEGVESLGKFDAVLFTGSVRSVPEHFFTLLNENGRLLIVEGQKPAMSAKVFYKYAGEIREDSVFETELERLKGFEDKPEFVF